MKFKYIMLNLMFSNAAREKQLFQRLMFWNSVSEYIHVIFVLINVVSGK